MIDLHTHTTMSDGTLSPEELVRAAHDRGLDALAITDHDTLGGVDRARSEGEKHGIEVITGVEISSQWDGGILHVLGYFVDPLNQTIQEKLEYLRKGRRERIIAILEKLRQCNVPVSEEEIQGEAPGGVPGRPHLAVIMQRKRYVKTLQEAFDRYLRRGARAYVEKVKLHPEEAIGIINHAGGMPVLAHPYSLNENDPQALERIVRHLMALGLRGIEAHYPAHTPKQTVLYLALAKKLDLGVSGGTDFHGANKPDVHLGVLPGRDPIPDSVLVELKRRHAFFAENLSSAATPVNSEERTDHGFQRPLGRG